MSLLLDMVKILSNHNEGTNMLKLIIVAALVFSTSNYAAKALDLSQEAAKELFDKGQGFGASVDLNNDYNYKNRINVICNKKVMSSVDLFNIGDTSVEVVTESTEEDSLIEYKCYLRSE